MQFNAEEFVAEVRLVNLTHAVHSAGILHDIMDVLIDIEAVSDEEISKELAQRFPLPKGYSWLIGSYGRFKGGLGLYYKAPGLRFRTMLSCAQFDVGAYAPGLLHAI